MRTVRVTSARLHTIKNARAYARGVGWGRICGTLRYSKPKQTNKQKTGWVLIRLDLIKEIGPKVRGGWSFARLLLQAKSVFATVFYIEQFPMHLIFVEINATDAKMVVASAETCCEEDVYHFDDVDRFFMVSCLALW